MSKLDSVRTNLNLLIERTRNISNFDISFPQDFKLKDAAQDTLNQTKTISKELEATEANLSKVLDKVSSSKIPENVSSSVLDSVQQIINRIQEVTKPLDSVEQSLKIVADTSALPEAADIPALQSLIDSARQTLTNVRSVALNQLANVNQRFRDYLSKIGNIDFPTFSAAVKPFFDSLRQTLDNANSALTGVVDIIQKTRDIVTRISNLELAKILSVAKSAINTAVIAISVAYLVILLFLIAILVIVSLQIRKPNKKSVK